MAKSRRMRWMGHVAPTGRDKNAHKICQKTLRKRNHLGNICVYGRIIIKWILKTLDLRIWTGFLAHNLTGYCENRNEH
jgi:hypothetical protein